MLSVAKRSSASAKRLLTLGIAGLLALSAAPRPRAANAHHSFAALETTTARHAYHASILELRLNPETQQVEMSLKVFTDDLEKALSQGQPAPVSLRDQGRALPLADRYLRQHLALSLPNGQVLTVQFLGMQAEKDAYWLYAKAPLPRPTAALRLRYTLLLDVFADQMNIVNAEAGAKKTSALLRNGHEEELLSL